MSSAAAAPPGNRGGLMGSLKDALLAAGLQDTGKPVAIAAPQPPPLPEQGGAPQVRNAKDNEAPASPSAEEAAREARGGTRPLEEVAADLDRAPTTRVVRASQKVEDVAERTTLVRGKLKVQRGAFEQDPVVGWLVVVGGPGIGQFRPIFEGNNTVGRGAGNRIAVDFGDDAISQDEQAYIRYDSSDRSFLFVPNLAKTNVVSVNDKRPTGAVELQHMDVITMGRTQLVFIPFCGPEFDWSALSEG